MPINNETTVVVPAITAVPEKTYPHLWLTDIHVQAKNNTRGSLRIEAVPYNGDTGEIAEVRGPNKTDKISVIRTEDLWSAVQEVPEVAIAMQCIFDAVDPLKAWLVAKEEEAAAAEAAAIAAAAEEAAAEQAAIEAEAAAAEALDPVDDVGAPSEEV